MRLWAAVFLVIVFLLIPAASAAEVILSTPQSGYTVLTGEEAAIPITLVSTYDHDITGTLKLASVPVNAGAAGSESSRASVNSRSFSAFTEKRTVMLPVGRSDIPADYHLTITFSYPEDGGRLSTLGGITIHFVTKIDEEKTDTVALAGTDIADPAAGTSSAGSAPQESPKKEDPKESPAAAVQNNQMPQDTSALKNQMAEESNQSRNNDDALLGYILADPLIIPLDNELKGAGFKLGTPDINPVSNRSGKFLLTYSSGTKKVIVQGAVRETRVLFAEESSDVSVHLPDALLENRTYREYGNRSAERGFIRTRTQVNFTSLKKTVDLTFSDAKSRNLHLKAEILNGTVTAVDGENPDDPLASAIPVIGFVCILLISAGIWYLARFRQEERTVPRELIPGAGSKKSSREIAGDILDDAEQDAARGNYPEAYRKTGRALRVFLSYESGSGDELTSGELEPLIASCTGDFEQIRFVLDRCSAVGFAKDTPRAGEFTDMIRSVRAFLEHDPAH
ncbi:hypothetical protein [uncultured Methanoregula sp.]|uniref:hypothetical protein n=1 Tax=uncultured Methanoregula sp. TaxID=1005933 RepID=UPI002AAB04B1|nr:hypothetical protein [uncultured Methanoregula sp.]